MQTSLGTLSTRQPRTHDRRDGQHYMRAILPPYICHTMEILVMVEALYPDCVSTSRMEEALQTIVGERFTSMSPAVVTMIIERWQHAFGEWSVRTITKRYVRVWADGIYTKVCTTNDRPCMLVIIGCDERGQKELLVLDDGTLGFWEAINNVFPDTWHQGYTVHALCNVMDKLPKKLQETEDWTYIRND